MLNTILLLTLNSRIFIPSNLINLPLSLHNLLLTQTDALYTCSPGLPFVFWLEGIKPYGFIRI